MFKKYLKKGAALLLAAGLFLSPQTAISATQVAAPVDMPNWDLPPAYAYALNADSDNALPFYAYKQDISSLSGNAEQVAKLTADVLLDYGADSVQYAMMDNGRIILSGQAGLDDVSAKKAPTKDSIYGIGSISKVFTTAAVMRLVDQGKINLDDPVTAYIPDFKMKDERYKKITVRMLLNHSSGLMGSSFANAMLLGDNDHSAYDNLLKSLSKQKLKAEPGAFSVYCNDGFSLAELVVERVSGLTFTEYLRRNIISSDMKNTYTPMDEFDRSRMAGIYDEDGITRLPYETLSAIGAGGIYSSAEDLCSFATSFMKSGSGLLSQESRKAMENKEYLNGLWVEDTPSSIAYGLGWDSVNLPPFAQYDIKGLYKGGDTAFYHGSLLVLPEENISIAVLTSGGSSPNNQMFAQNVLTYYLKDKNRIKELPKEPVPASLPKTAMPAAYEDFSGLYGNYAALYRVTIQKGTLICEFPAGSQTTPLILDYTEDGWFSLNNGILSMKPINANGNSYLISKSVSALPGLGYSSSTQFEAQKFPDNPLSEQVRAAWNKRNNSLYFLINEKYSSIAYQRALPVAAMGNLKAAPGFIGTNKIVDENSYEPFLQIPMSGSRDQAEGHFYTKNGIEYFETNGAIYISEKAVKSLPTEKTFTTALASSGYTRYYKIGKASAGKKIKVTVPDKASFVVYDQNGEVKSNYYLDRANTATLPSGGYIAFIGSPKASFTVQYK